MSKFEKLIAKLRSLPTEMDKDDIIKVLSHYGFEIDQNTGSHIIVSHERLIGIKGYGVYGEFALPTKKGRKIMKYYLKEAVIAIDTIQKDEE